MKGFPDLPPLWLLAFMGVAWGLAQVAPDPQWPTYLIKGGGIASAAAGLALIFWSAFWFWRKRTTIEPHHTPGTLIIEGPYRLSRNPIYLGMAMILWGYTCWLAFLPSLLLTPLFLYILTRRFAVPEERALLEAFGEEGRTYLAATRRWV